MCVVGEGMETKERKGEGRGRLSPGKKMAPLGPCWAQLSATQWRVAGPESHSQVKLPAMLVAALVPRRLSFRGGVLRALLPCVTQ